MLGDELLVGRYDAFPRLQGARAVFQRRAAAADRLDKDRDLRVGLDHGKVPHHFLFKRVAGKISPDKNVFEFDRLSGAFGDFRGIAAKDLADTAADRSVTRNGDLLHIFSSVVRKPVNFQHFVIAEHAEAADGPRFLIAAPQRQL